MYILACDTSSSRGSLALSSTEKPGQVLATSFWLRERSHSEIINDEYLKLLAQVGLSGEQVDLYGVGIGPGSFTGIRVGINFIRSLSYCYQRPVFSMNSLQIMANQVSDTQKKVLALANAFRNLMYLALYQSGAKGEVEELQGPQALSVDEVETLIKEEVICVGSGFDAFATQFTPSLKAKLLRPNELCHFPKAETLALLLAQDPSRGPLLSWNEVIPLYIRASEAEEKHRKQLLKN